MQILATLFSLFLFLPLQPVYATNSSNAVPILAFHQVNQHISRGARPLKVGLEALAKMGVKTILNIDNSKTEIAAEAKNAKALGLDMISLPMSGFWEPKDAQVEKILAVLTDPANYPLFIHCQHGHDRTGLIMGLYRIQEQNWSAKEAYTEMLALGFHKQLVFLNHYFEKKTGMDD